MKIIRCFCLFFAAVLPALLAAPAKKVSPKGEFLVYAGTYTRQARVTLYFTLTGSLPTLSVKWDLV